MRTVIWDNGGGHYGQAIHFVEVADHVLPAAEALAKFYAAVKAGRREPSLLAVVPGKIEWRAEESNSQGLVEWAAVLADSVEWEDEAKLVEAATQHLTPVARTVLRWAAERQGCRDLGQLIAGSVEPDATVSNQGSCWSLQLRTTAAGSWVKRHAEVEAYQWLAPNRFAGDWRAMRDLVTAMVETGLDVEVER